MKYFILFQGLLTIFIAGGLFFKESTLKNRSIAIYFLLFGYEILYFVYGTSLIPTIYPGLRGLFYFSLGLLYGPLLLFHFQSVVYNKNKIKWVDLLHFIPVLFLNIYLSDILMMDTLERYNYFQSEEVFFNRILYVNYARALHQIIYAFILYYIYRRNKSDIELNQRFYLRGMSIIYLITTIAISLLVLFARSWNDFSLYYLLSNVLTILILYVIYNDPKFFKAFKAKYQSSALEVKDMDRISEKMEDVFKKEKLYLQNNLTIESLAKTLGIKSHQISQTLSSHLDDSFNDYVNRQRISHAKRLLVNSTLNHYKIEAIAEMSGFNNKVTFYKAFSKFTSTTPSKFRKERQ